jgi:hypothetical protein
MASAACTTWKSRSYEGGWHDWYTDFDQKSSDGYCWKSGSSTTYAFCFSFKTPSASKFHKSTSLSVTIPIVRTSSSFAKSGTLYFKLLTSDPTGGSITGNLKPSSSNYDASCSWSVSDLQVHKVSFTISSTSLNPDTTYYITVGGSKLIGIGYFKYTPSGGWWSATFNYDTYTDVTASKPTITDNKNNTFTIVGSAGTAGTNNAVNSTALYYRIGDSGSYTKHSSLTKAGSLTCAASATSQKVCAYTVVDGTYADKQSSTAELSIKNYQSPSAPGKPYLTDSSFKNGRLTVKQGWIFSWDAATATNTNSPVKGYWIRLWRLPKGSTDWVAVNNIKQVESGSGNTYMYLHSQTTPGYNSATWENTKTSLVINHPVNFGFAAGDKVQLEVAAYSKNGKSTPDQLWSPKNNGYYTLSDHYLVQNAGVINAKVDNSWKEGQVYVKVDGTWKEAETVNVKVNGSWKESQ